ncbi:MAG: selenoprotein B glycine/betaine/sarcosine/D-proline reductase [Deltaproteobacteria bacterium RBG_13_43_22]|nr:MAG: selenoprotein B glycine/betaine/sarcosine/D-proline reductase [Deltaproteobacteria bacterium RBG_13_43_22]
MARLDRMSPPERKYIEELKCPTFDTNPWVDGPPLEKRRVAIISTAGLHRREDRPFTFDPGDYYRILPGDIKAEDLVMSHVSTNFDHSGFQQDRNVVFPIDRLNELAKEGTIGSVADFHYSFMGAVDPMQMEQEARNLASILKIDKVDGLVLVPV